MPRTDQLVQLDKAYEDFVRIVRSLALEDFLASLGDWTPRDILAHLIGWNYNIRLGCQQIQTGVAPLYHSDALNDYRTLNAQFITRYSSTDRGQLLRQLAQGKQELSAYLGAVDERDWDRDFGALHYRGGPATVGRSVESITRDYIDHAREISEHPQTP